MTIHVITACHDRKKTTQRFINNLKEQTICDQIHLILVDDRSTDGTGEMVKREMPNATVSRGNGNLWWGGALHQAYKWIINNNIPDDDVVFFSNDDNSYSHGYLEKELNRLKENTNTLIAGNGFSMKTGEQLDGVSWCDLKSGEITLLGTDATGNLASTRALMMRVSDLKKIGGFHPILLPHYLSDYEFVLRASRKGLKVRTYEDLVYEYDNTLTGAKNYKKITLKVLFSKKCPYNPIYKTIYLFMITPVKYLPVRFFRQAKNNKKQVCNLMKEKREK